MKKYMFEILPDGSIGARYFFNMKGEPPAQMVKEGSVLMEVPIMGEETPEELALLQEARTRPHAVRLNARGKLERRERGSPLPD